VKLETSQYLANFAVAFSSE